MADMADMTLSEAEKVLGVSSGASRDDIQSAYRKLAQKYHPDAWINKSKSEQSYAESVYKKLNVAKRVLLNPSVAKPDDVPNHSESPYGTPRREHNGTDSFNNATNAGHHTSSTPYRGNRTFVPPQASPYDGVNVRQQTQRTQQTYVPKPNKPQINDESPRQGSRDNWSSTSSSADGRKKFNKAKSFTDQFGQTKDKFEENLSNQYRRYANHRYRQGTDVFRMSSSLLTTVSAVIMMIYVIYARVQMVAAAGGVVVPASLIGGIPTDTVLLMLAACAIKAMAYDFTSVYYVDRQLRTVSPLMAGVPFAIGGIVIGGIGACLFAGIDMVPFVVLIVGSIVIGGIISAVNSVNAKNDEQND